MSFVTLNNAVKTPCRKSPAAFSCLSEFALRASNQTRANEVKVPYKKANLAHTGGLSIATNLWQCKQLIQFVRSVLFKPPQK